MLFETQPETRERMGVSAEELGRITAEQAFAEADLNHDGAYCAHTSAQSRNRAVSLFAPRVCPGKLSFEEFQASPGANLACEIARASLSACFRNRRGTASLGATTNRRTRRQMLRRR